MQKFAVRFWGTRGSVPVTGPQHLRYGGNTPCIEFTCGDHHLFFDAGSGLYPAGSELIAKGIHDIDLLFTHCHHDHMMGLPLFAPLFDPALSITLWSGHLWGRMTTRDMVMQYMRKPWFPALPDECGGRLRYRDFKPGEVLHPRPGLTVRTLSIEHTDGCTGYRVEWAGRAVVLVFDYEHQAGVLDPGVLAHISNADLVVYDSTYTETEMPMKLGYGHSTWQHGVKLAQAANARRLALFHHAPWRSDDELDSMEYSAKAAFAGAFAARDGQIVDL